MSKKIAIDARIWRSQTGGLGRYARNLVHELASLDKENHYTVIITPEDEAEYDVSAPNFRSQVVPIPHYSYAEQTKLNRLLAAEKFDLVHFTHFNHPILYRGPFVVTVHDLIMHLYPSGKQNRSWLRKLAYRLVMSDTKRAERIIVPSQSTKDDLVKMLGMPAEKIVVTPEGSEAKFRPHTESEIAAIKQKLNLPDRFILFVSRWERYKGLVELIEAYGQLAAKYPDLALVITGKPARQAPDVAELIRAKQQEGLRIITPGFIDDEDLAPLYSAASVYVHPSWYEGFGIMILEAFAAGVPVVTSKVSSLPEVVGDAGLLVNPRSVEEISGAISQILENESLADELKRKGLERVGQYSWRKMAEQTLAVYREVLKKT